MLLGTGMVAATAAGRFPSLRQACAAMARPGRRRTPDPLAGAIFDRDYRVFLKMQEQRAEIDAM